MPNRDADGKFRGLSHEAILYDPEALVEPICIVHNLTIGSLREQTPYVYFDCLQTRFNVEGRTTPLAPGDRFEFEVADIYGRPWEQYFEEGTSRPDDPEALFDFE